MKRFRPFVTLFALILAVGLMAAEGGAARGARGARGTGTRFGGMGMFGTRGRGMSKMMLINSEQIQKELKITEEQVAKIRELQTAQREEMRNIFTGMGNMRDMSAEERTKAREEMTKKREAMTKATEKKLAKLIKKEQNKRLNEIVLQQAGVDGLTSDYVVKGLKLTKEQVTKIKAALKARDDELQKLMESMRGSFGRRRPRAEGGDNSAERQRPDMTEMREKMTAIRKKGEEKAMSVLTEEQKKGLEKLKGKKFELDRNALFRRRGTFGGNTGQRRERPQGGEGRTTGTRRRRQPEGDGGN